MLPGKDPRSAPQLTTYERERFRAEIGPHRDDFVYHVYPHFETGPGGSFGIEVIQRSFEGIIRNYDVDGEFTPSVLPGEVGQDDIVIRDDSPFGAYRMTIRGFIPAPFEESAFREGMVARIEGALNQWLARNPRD